jgi:hypothetical protein
MSLLNQGRPRRLLDETRLADPLPRDLDHRPPATARIVLSSWRGKVGL